jgi:hypothetical protein
MSGVTQKSMHTDYYQIYCCNEIHYILLVAHIIPLIGGLGRDE